MPLGRHKEKPNWPNMLLFFILIFIVFFAKYALNLKLLLMYVCIVEQLNFSDCSLRENPA